MNIYLTIFPSMTASPEPGSDVSLSAAADEEATEHVFGVVVVVVVVVIELASMPTPREYTHDRSCYPCIWYFQTF